VVLAGFKPVAGLREAAWVGSIPTRLRQFWISGFLVLRPESEQRVPGRPRGTVPLQPDSAESSKIALHRKTHWTLMAKARISCVQMDCVIADPEYNRGQIVDHIERAAAAASDLVIFPECAITGYCYDSLEEASRFAEPLDGPTMQAIANACRHGGAYAIAGFIEKEGSEFYNAAMLVGPGGLVGSYRKVHLPYLGVDRFLTPGDKPFLVFDLPFGRVGINICYDASFPEAARVLKLLGAQIIALPTNWPPGAWRTPKFTVNARANENHVYFAAVDRVGTERGWRFIGNSKVVDYNGDTMAEAGSEKEEVLVVELDLKAADDNRSIFVPGKHEVDRIGDRRPEFYGLVAKGEAARLKKAGD